MNRVWEISENVEEQALSSPLKSWDEFPEEAVFNVK